MKYFLLSLLLLLSVVSRSSPDSVAYSRDYEFKEGFFLTAEQFRTNSPILKNSVVSGYPKSEVDFMTQMLEQKFLTYKADDGSEQKVETSSLWGYCQNRSIFIYFNNDFHRLNVIGTLCHFTAAINTSITYNDPMNTYGINTSNEMRQYIFDTRTDKILEFVVNNMEVIMEDDPELLSEFTKLKKRKKADSIFIYLRKYNEKHPFYLPRS
jgi:hypothetical protein